MPDRSASIGARLDRLPSAHPIWVLLLILSLGAFFEIYDISLTPIMSPILVKAGLFHEGAKGLFGMSDLASFAAATFAGLWLGTIGFSAIADRIGRRPIFAVSLLWYALATLIMGFQSDAMSIDLWRFVAGIGVGVQMVATDCYISELMPKAIRGRGFVVSNGLQFTAIPIAAILSVLVAHHTVFGISGWRWLAFFPAIGAVFVWIVLKRLPESPRWLASRGRYDEAENITSALEARVATATRCPLPAPTVTGSAPVPAEHTKLPRMLDPPYRNRMIMLILFHILQTIGFYGFSNWLPTLLVAQGVNLKDSLAYSAIIALSYPVAPLLFITIADKIERKWLIVVGALGVAVCGLLFARQSTPMMWIVFGALVTVFNTLMSIGYHIYQSELFPTRIRAGAVGAAYSFSRLSAIFSGYLIAYTLQISGVIGVLSLITCAMIGVALLIGLAGPQTTGRTLEEI